MMFFIDQGENLKYTYHEFLNALNERLFVYKYIYTKSYIDIWCNILLSFYYNKPVYLLDSDFSTTEINQLGIAPSELKIKYEIDKIRIHSLGEFISRCKSNNTPCLHIYTSGTTGRPKSVGYNWMNLTRAVKTGEKFIDNIWGLAYNPTHFAGIQVFFQALLNSNTLVNVFDINDFGGANEIDKNNITNISATPSYYRKLLHSGLIFPKVLRVSIGGEKVDESLIEKLKKIFPHAVIRNIYASTEGGSLFSSDGEIFFISNRLKDFIKILEDRELLLHSSLLGSFSVGNNEEWYHTGDIVDLLSPNSFKIVSRITEMINVGGYKVNPNEVESVVNKFAGIVDCKVYSKRSSVLGNILVCDIQAEENCIRTELEYQLICFLKERIQSFKIPRIFYFVEEIKKTRTGKKERK